MSKDERTVPILLTVVFVLAMGCLLTGWLVQSAVNRAASAPVPQVREKLDVELSPGLRLVGLAKMQDYVFVRIDDSLVCPPYSSCGNTKITRVGIIAPGVFLAEGDGFDAACRSRPMHWVVNENDKSVIALDDAAAVAKQLKEKFNREPDSVKMVDPQDFEDPHRQR